MRHKGRITEWNDDRGFGFVVPVAGGDRVFIHIKAFANRQRRPQLGEIVVYELGRDENGRARGTNLTLSADLRRTSAPSAPRPGPVPLIFIALFVVVLAGAVMSGTMSLAVPGTYLTCSAVTYLTYAWDKSAARNERRRTPESTLHLLSLVGGWPGALVAQRTLRHKSKKQSFQRVFWITVIVNCGALVWILVDVNA